MSKDMSKSPCQAIILVRYEIYENTANGQVTGIPINRASKIFTFMGKNEEEVTKEVNKFMERINNYEAKSKT